MERRINRNNQTPNGNKGITPLSLLEKKKQREQAQQETKANLKK